MTKDLKNEEESGELYSKAIKLGQYLCWQLPKFKACYEETRDIKMITEKQ